uniref:Secreted protein n=1 Tax=Strongyloides venezuelensis TaxID=75913 RepID=A0A0K0G5V5_STRVS
MKILFFTTVILLLNLSSQNSISRTKRSPDEDHSRYIKKDSASLYSSAYLPDDLQGLDNTDIIGPRKNL